MSDLIERLRERNRKCLKCGDETCNFCRERTEAADEIERLRQGVISLRCQYDELADKNAKLQAEIEMLWDQLKDAERRETEAERRRERLRGALEKIAHPGHGGYCDELVREIAREALEIDDD